MHSIPPDQVSDLGLKASIAGLLIIIATLLFIIVFQNQLKLDKHRKQKMQKS